MTRQGLLSFDQATVAPPEKPKRLWSVWSVPDTFARGVDLIHVADAIVTSDGLRLEQVFNERARRCEALVAAFVPRVEAGLELPDEAGAMLRIDGRVETLADQREAVDRELQRLSNSRLICE